MHRILKRKSVSALLKRKSVSALQRTRYLVALVGVSLSVAALAAAPAAVAAKSSCGGSSWCMWENAYYEGTLWTYSIGSYPQNKWFYVGGDANDEASSTFNNRVHNTWVSENWEPSGGIVCTTPGGSKENLREWKWPQNENNANDTISSLDLEESGTSCEGDPKWEPGSIEDDTETSPARSTTPSPQQEAPQPATN